MGSSQAIIFFLPILPYNNILAGLKGLFSIEWILYAEVVLNHIK